VIRWREPNAYVRKSLSHGRWVGLCVVLMAAPLLLVTSGSFSRGAASRLATTALGSVLGIVGGLGFIRIWTGPGDIVCLNEEEIIQAPGTSAHRCLYKNIAYCKVSQDSYRGTVFFVLRFTLKKGLPAGQVRQVAVPDNLTLKQVVQFLCDKGVKTGETG